MASVALQVMTTMSAWPIMHELNACINATASHFCLKHLIKGNVCVCRVHITGDVAMAFRLLWRMSRDSTWLKDTAWPLIKASADFFSSRVVPQVPPPLGWNTSTCMRKLS